MSDTAPDVQILQILLRFSRRMPILAQVSSVPFLSHPPLPQLGCSQLQARWSTGSSVAAAYRPLLEGAGLLLSLGELGFPLHHTGTWND